MNINLDAVKVASLLQELEKVAVRQEMIDRYGSDTVQSMGMSEHEWPELQRSKNILDSVQPHPDQVRQQEAAMWAEQHPATQKLEHANKVMNRVQELHPITPPAAPAQHTGFGKFIRDPRVHGVAGLGAAAVAAGLLGNMMDSGTRRKRERREREMRGY